MAPPRGEVIQCLFGFGVFPNPEASQGLRCTRGAGCGTCGGVHRGGFQRSQLPVCQPAVHPVEAVGVVELCSDHRRHSEGDQTATVLGGQRPQHAHQWQIGRRPGLIKPLFSDRPAAVMGQPGQVGMQHEAELTGDRLRASAHGRTAIASRSRLSSISRPESSTMSKSAQLTAATSASRSSGHGVPASARTI